MLDAPLVTERLSLRTFRRQDVDPLDEAIRETVADLVRWLPWAQPGHTRADTRRYVRHVRLARARRASQEFAICAATTERILGVIGLHRLDWSRRSAGLGYWLRRSEWGRGLATEAGTCIVDYGFRALGLNRIEAHVAIGNGRSQRVVERLGFRREGIARGIERIGGLYVDHIQYGLLRGDVLDPDLAGGEETA